MQISLTLCKTLKLFYRNMQRNAQAFQQPEPGPVQSRSFRVLQKITSTDTPDEVDGEQVRKLQLTEDDRALMNKFKEQGKVSLNEGNCCCDVRFF